MKASLAAIGTAILVFGATTANAGGSIKDAPNARPLSWTGFYVGANAGYGWSGDDILAAGPAAPFVFGGMEPAGGFAGGQIGYNWQAGRLVVGVEADIQKSAISDSALVVERPVSSDLNWFGTVRGRIGLVTDSALLYFTGGFAFGNLHHQVTIGNGTFFESNNTESGYTLGGGLEYKFNPAWTLKAEYQYLDFGKNQATRADGGA